MSDPKYRPWMSDELTEETKATLQKEFKIHNVRPSNKTPTARDRAINALLFGEAILPYNGYTVEPRSTSGEYHKLVLKNEQYRNETRQRAIKALQGK